MKIITAVIPRTSRLEMAQELSREARWRLRWMDYYESHGHNARLTCRHFDISPQTFYRWKRRYTPKNLKTLEDRSRRPRRVRQPTASADLIEAVLETRQECPRWGKEKIARLLNEESWQVSVSIPADTLS